MNMNRILIIYSYKALQFNMPVGHIENSSDYLLFWSVCNFLKSFDVLLL
jgi:hypothetical protein